MEQYSSIKKDHSDKLLLFRMGDFYELFNEDAKTASELLNITLTKRNKKSGDDTLMCGFPHHSMESPVNRLLDAGYCVAICDQLEDPSESKGLVKRGITLMLSPGVVFNPANLEAEKNCFVFSFDKNMASWIEPSTGKAFFKKTTGFDDVKDLILKLQPRELLCQNDRDFISCDFFPGLRQNFDSSEALKKLKNKDSRKSLLSYLKLMQGDEASFGFTNWTEIKNKDSVKINAQFFNHLEVFKSNDGDSSKSLFHSIRKTKTPGGSRLLRLWLENPLLNLEQIRSRQEGVYKWKEDFTKLSDFREKLAFIGDFERRVARAGHPLGGPADFLRLKTSLEYLLDAFSDLFFKDRKTLAELLETLEKAIEEEPPGQWASKGGYIKKGLRENLDSLIDLSSGAQDEIYKLEAEEKEKTKINGLKIRFNNVFGFYIEVTKANKDKVPEHYVRKQTLTNAERFTTKELSALEEKVLSAKSKKIALEKEVFFELKKMVRDLLKPLKEAAEMCNLEDVYSSMAFLVFEKNFSVPVITPDHAFEISEGFHPVVADDLLKSGEQSFVSNTIKLDENNSFCLITGPNMAGKSTMMRQVILTAYLGQCGLVVPAQSSVQPLYDGFYTRVGASDILSEGLSTFMVEMKETSYILKNATKDSLLILDEIGRGTSSHDGSALAESIVSYIIEKIGCHSLFATHYHELTDVFKDSVQVRNIHMGYSEFEGRIVFTYKIKSGPSQKSYGIEVARLAGLPTEVIENAKKPKRAILDTDEYIKEAANGNSELEKTKVGVPSQQLEFNIQTRKERVASQRVMDELALIKPAEMTPIEALTKIAKWQDSYL